MSKLLRVLQVEDSASDAALIRRVLGKAGYQVGWARVEDSDEMRASLAGQAWDVILADNRMPRFNATAALEVLHETGRDIPFVVVSGTVGEDVAVNLMKSGAHDYVMKDNLARLAPVVEREIREAATRLERRQAEEWLRESEERLSLAIHTTQLGLFDYNPQTGKAISSESAKRHLGLPPEAEVSYDMYLAAVHPDDREGVRRAVGQALRGERGGHYATEYRNIGIEDRVERWVSAQGRVFFDDAGRPARFIGVTLDITERKRAEQAIERANQDLRQFAYAAAHDLQEPLRNVGTSLGLLMRNHESELDEEAARLVADSLDAAERVHGMVKDLLAFTRVTENVSRPRVLVNAGEVFERVLGYLAAAVKESGAQVDCGPLPLVPMQPVHLAELLQNLVGNAIKYRKKEVRPSVVVSAELRNAEWLFTVADNGIGFDPAYAERIFRVFKRLHQRHEYPGNGIGLAICSRIVASYGGRIWAEGRPGQGATFYFTVPCEW